LILAYFDETKKLRDPGTSVVFGGCAAPSADWDEFNRRWRGALDGTGITTVKTSAALAFRDDFYGWSERETERDELLFRLATIIHDAPIVKITCPILAGDFESLPAPQRAKLRDSQYCGFEVCVRTVVESYLPADAFQIVCDLTEDYAQGCITLFNLLRQKNPDLKRRLLAISFGDDTYLAPLQAADMVAYCSRANAEWQRFGQEPQSVIRRIIELFSSKEAKSRYFVYRAGSAGIGYAEPD
jgi:hypothetical protein